MRYFPFLIILFLASCIGTDEVDDPMVGESITLEREQLALVVGGTAMAEATFFNRYGIEEDAQLIWNSSNESVATVDIDGTITALSVGQSNLIATVGGTTSQALLVTVVENQNDVAQILLSSPIGNQISVGQEISLSVEVLNVLGDPIEGAEVVFTALDPEYLEVNQEGVATGVADGFGRIVASVEGVQSNTLGIQVGQTSRTGNFVGANGYDASGSTELFLGDNGDLMLSLSSNFDTDFALGTYIYLSNSTSGSVTRNEGLEIQEISSGGSHLFNVSNLDPNIAIDDFDYVIVLCKPATITFGYAELN
jgi:hypothetical protein